MSIVELARGLSLPHLADRLEPADDDDARAGDFDIRLEVHDASRLEWTVAVPLEEQEARKYTVLVEMEVPANVFARHSPWDQLQSWTRLDGPAERIEPGATVTIDALRRATNSFAHRLARMADGFVRHCRLAGLQTTSRREELVEGLQLWLGAALATVHDARARIVAPSRDDSAEIARERALIDEFVSVRLLEMLASAERALASLAASKHAEELATAVGEGEVQVAEALAREVAHREARGWLGVDARSAATLEAYLDRASRLKKHFQEVLFLEAETFQVAERIHHWVAAFVALVASTWAFAWQLALSHRAPTTGSTIGSGVFVIAAIAGLVYATKDRIKEMGRAWISGNVHRFYAQRVARWRAPERRIARRAIVVTARESFDQNARAKPDPLNPECGASIAATLVRFVHRGEVVAKKRLGTAGVHRVKHIFRYDLSPLFARLDDAVKQVPVLDDVTRRVRFTDAPRRYRVPVRVRVSCGGIARGLEAVLVMDKRGLERLEAEVETEGEPL
jgi:hypothetical protein